MSERSTSALRPAPCVTYTYTYKHCTHSIYIYIYMWVGGGTGGGGGGRWKRGAKLCIPGPCDMSCYQSHIDHSVHMSVHHGKYFAHVQTCDT